MQRDAGTIMTLITTIFGRDFHAAIRRTASNLICIARHCSPRQLSVTLVMTFCTTIGTTAAMERPLPVDLNKAEQRYALGTAVSSPDETYSAFITPFIQGEQRSYIYSPSLLTIAAGIESRNYDRGDSSTWQRESLSWKSIFESYYTRPVSIYVHRGSASEKRIFLLLGSSYSTWQRGTWTNKVINLLRREFGDPHIIAMPGFLTPEVLESRPRRPMMTVREPALDLYARLRDWISEEERKGLIPKDFQMGILGFSGGGSLAIALLAEDQRQFDLRGGQRRRLFDRGAIALSPVLDAPTSFGALDRANAILDQEGFPAGRALTKPIFPDFLLALLRGFSASNPKPYLRLTAKKSSVHSAARRHELIGRFYREFQVVDLATVAAAPWEESAEVRREVKKVEKRGPLNYGNFFTKVARSEGDEDSLERTLSQIKGAPLYIVFPQDDPVLSRVDPEIAGRKVVGMPKPLNQLIARARTKENIRVFTPPRGAHLGYFLDMDYMQEILTRFFAGRARTSSSGHLPQGTRHEQFREETSLDHDLKGGETTQ